MIARLLTRSARGPPRRLIGTFNVVQMQLKLSSVSPPTIASAASTATACGFACGALHYMSSNQLLSLCKSAPPPASTVHSPPPASNSYAADEPTHDGKAASEEDPNGGAAKPSLGDHTSAALSDAEAAATTKPLTFWQACKYIWSLVDGRLLLFGCALTVGGVLLGLWVPIQSAALLKAAQQGGLTLRGVLIVLGLANLQALFKVGGAACLASAGNQIKRRLRSTLFASILAQELGWVHEQRATALIASIGTDTDTVGHAVTNSISVGLGSLAKVVGSLISLTLISPQLTCVVLLIAPPTAFFAATCARREAGMRRGVLKAGDDAVAGASEVVEKLQTVQAYAQEDREHAAYDRLLERHGRLERTLFIFHRMWTTVMQLVLSTGTALSLALAGWLAHQGRFDPAFLLPFSQLAMGIGQGVGALTFLSGDAAKVREAVRRLRDVSERCPTILGEEGATLARDSPFLVGEMGVHDVSFAYPSRPHQKVLDGCTLTLEPGKTTALVGPSGGGKSTVQLLLARFYDPQAGRVELDKVDVRSLKPRWLRGDVVGVVTQEPVLLPGSIRDNIAYARPDASFEEVVAAAKAGNAHDYICKLADGYDTQLGGGGGGGLSVGQKQRLAIARALLKDPKVLLLDEPTSALDPASEAAVQQALDRLSKGRTTLVVAHRLSTVRDADCICVLVGGKVVERGTHNELLRLGGVYSRMVESQSLAATEPK